MYCCSFRCWNQIYVYSRCSSCRTEEEKNHEKNQEEDLKWVSVLPLNPPHPPPPPPIHTRPEFTAPWSPTMFQVKAGEPTCPPPSPACVHSPGVVGRKLLICCLYYPLRRRCVARCPAGGAHAPSGLKGGNVEPRRNAGGKQRPRDIANDVLNSIKVRVVLWPTIFSSGSHGRAS